VSLDDIAKRRNGEVRLLDRDREEIADDLENVAGLLRKGKLSAVFLIVHDAEEEYEDGRENYCIRLLDSDALSFNEWIGCLQNWVLHEQLSRVIPEE
jgi:hypothetical protein